MNAVANPGETLPKNMPRGREVLVDKICHLIQATENLMGPSRDLTKITNRFNEKFKNTDLKKLARLVEVARLRKKIYLSTSLRLRKFPQNQPWTTRLRYLESPWIITKFEFQMSFLRTLNSMT